MCRIQGTYLLVVGQNTGIYIESAGKLMLFSAEDADTKTEYIYIYIQGLRSRAAGRRPLRLRKEEQTFSRKAEKKHKWRNWRLENAKRSIYSTTVQDRDDYDYEFVIIIHSPSP